jgi:basic amino acid/polyamine antiporter, APA family
VTSTQPRQLLRILGPFDGLAIVVGIIIGVGILRTPGLIASYLGSPWLILLMWLVGGIMVMMSTLTLAELSAMFPRAGGKYLYAREAFGDVVGFTVGWAELAGIRAFTAASKAVVFGGYLVTLAGAGSAPVFAGAMVITLLLIHLIGLRAGSLFQNITTFIKVLLLVAVVGLALWLGDGASWKPGVSFTPEKGLWAGIILAYQSIWFTYYGWEDGVKMAGEVTNPGRNMPRMLIGGALGVTVLYLLLNIAFLHALTPAGMAGSDFVARDALTSVLGDHVTVALTTVGLVVVLAGLNANFLGTPRIPYGLAVDGLGPRFLTSVNRGGTPTAALLLTAAIIFALAVTGTFELLIRFLTFNALIVDGIVFLALFRLRRSRPDMARPFRVPFYPLMPAVVLVMYGVVITVIVVTQPTLALGGTVFLAVFALVGWLLVGRKVPPSPDRGKGSGG